MIEHHRINAYYIAGNCPIAIHKLIKNSREVINAILDNKLNNIQQVCEKIKTELVNNFYHISLTDRVNTNFLKVHFIENSNDQYVLTLGYQLPKNQTYHYKLVFNTEKKEIQL